MVMVNTAVMASMAMVRSTGMATGMGTGRNSSSSYQSRFSSLHAPYLVLVIDRDEVGIRNDASVVWKRKKTVVKKHPLFP